MLCMRHRHGLRGPWDLWAPAQSYQRAAAVLRHTRIDLLGNDSTDSARSFVLHALQFAGEGSCEKAGCSSMTYLASPNWKMSENLQSKLQAV